MGPPFSHAMAAIEYRKLDMHNYIEDMYESTTYRPTYRDRVMPSLDRMHHHPNPFLASFPHFIGVGLDTPEKGQFIALMHQMDIYKCSTCRRLIITSVDAATWGFVLHNIPYLQVLLLLILDNLRHETFCYTVTVISDMIMSCMLAEIL